MSFRAEKMVNKVPPSLTIFTQNSVWGNIFNSVWQSTCSSQSKCVVNYAVCCQRPTHLLNDHRHQSRLSQMDGKKFLSTTTTTSCDISRFELIKINDLGFFMCQIPPIEWRWNKWIHVQVVDYCLCVLLGWNNSNLNDCVQWDPHWIQMASQKR